MLLALCAGAAGAGRQLPGLPVAGGRRHPALLRLIRKFVFRKREDSLNYNDHVKITKINTPEEFWARIKQKKSD